MTSSEDPLPPPRRHATATVTVQSSTTDAVDTEPGSSVAILHLVETFAGDLNGESPVWAVQLRHDDQSAEMVSVQRFRGELAGRRGSFVLRGEEHIADGSITATWAAVPGTGTGDLVGLRGEGGFTGRFGQGSEATLDYWFE